MQGLGNFISVPFFGEASAKRHEFVAWTPKPRPSTPTPQTVFIILSQRGGGGGGGGGGARISNSNNSSSATCSHALHLPRLLSRLQNGVGLEVKAVLRGVHKTRAFAAGGRVEGHEC